MGAFAKRRAQEAAAARAAQRARAPVEDKDDDNDEGPYKPPRWMYPLVVVADVVRVMGKKVRQCIDPRADDANALFQVEQAILVAARPAPIVQLGANAAVAERFRQAGSVGLGAGLGAGGAVDGTAASKVRAFQTNEPGSGSVRAADSRSRRSSEASVHAGKGSRAGTSDSSGMIEPLGPHTPSNAGRWGLTHKGSNGSFAGEGAQSSEKSSKKKGSKVAPSPTLDSPPLSGVRSTTTPRVPSGLPPLTPKTPVTGSGSTARKTTSAETIPRNSSNESFILSPGSDSKRPANRRLSASGGGKSGGRPVPAGMLADSKMGTGASFSSDASTFASSSQSLAFDKHASFGGRSLHGSHSGGLVRVPEVQVERTPVSTTAGKRRVAW